MLSRYVYANKEFWGRDKAYAKLGTWNVLVCVYVSVCGGWKEGWGMSVRWLSVLLKYLCIYIANI